MKLLYKSKFVEILYDSQKSLIIDKFLPDTIDMTVNDFKSEMLIFVEMCEKYLPKRELVHLLDMDFVIDIGMQDWMNLEIFPKYQGIIKLMAFVMPTELVPKLSISQTMDEEEGKKFKQSYFDNEEEAIDWLVNTTII